MLAHLALAAQRRGLLALASLALTTGRLRKREPLPPHLLTGIRGELEAFFHLRRLGYTVVARRWRSAELNGDLDLIAWDGPTLCFVEVKTRTRRDQYEARSTIGAAKQRILRRMARLYRQTALARDARHTTPIRFDVVSVYLAGKHPTCELLRHGFDADEEPRSPRSGV